MQWDKRRLPNENAICHFSLVPRTGAFRRSRHSLGGAFFTYVCFALLYFTLLYLFSVHPPLAHSMGSHTVQTCQVGNPILMGQISKGWHRQHLPRHCTCMTTTYFLTLWPRRCMHVRMCLNAARARCTRPAQDVPRHGTGWPGIPATVVVPDAHCQAQVFLHHCHLQ